MIVLNDLKKETRQIERIRKQKIEAREIVDKRGKMSIKRTWEFLFAKGFINDNYLAAREYKVDNMWLGMPCYILGAGPDLKTFIDQIGFEKLAGRHTIAINHVIEDFPEAENLFFLDRRFLEKTSFDIHQYRGLIFAQTTTGMPAESNVRLFTCAQSRPSKYFADGLYNANFSGIAALNLAIVAGANPIYLIGYGMGKAASEEGYHYKPNYCGEVKSEKVFRKFVRVQEQFEKFGEFGKRIVHVTDGKDIPSLEKKITVAQFGAMLDRKVMPVKVGGREAKIVHISFTDDLNKHAEITRGVIGNCNGQHVLRSTADRIEPADLYVLEHFISTDKYVNEFPYKQKAVAIVHSQNCIPRGPFRKVIALTNAWREKLFAWGIGNVEVIPGGIAVDEYKEIQPDYESKVFGRITRWSQGKIPADWNAMVQRILDADETIKCLFYTQFVSEGKRPRLVHDRMIYDETCQIADFKGEFLKNMSLYVHANGTFRETMSHAIIEAMATGLPIIYMHEDPIKEILGSNGIDCKTLQEVEANIMRLIGDPAEKERIGKLNKARAQKYNIETMIERYNEVFKRCLA